MRFVFDSQDAGTLYGKMSDVMFFSVTYEKSETARPVLECTGFNRIPLVNETMVKDTVAHINSKAFGQKLSTFVMHEKVRKIS